MPQVLTGRDITRYKKMIERKGKAGVDKFYAALREKGYPTGHWAASEYNPDSYYGIVTQHYLERQTGRALDANTRERLYRETAEQTLKAFEKKIKNGDGRTTEDLEYKEASEARNKAYTDVGLEDGKWVFDTPIQIQKALSGAAAAEAA